MKVRGVLSVLAIAFSILLPCFSQSSSAPLSYRQKLEMKRFGVPFPSSHDPEAWQQWRQQVQAQLAARRARIRANNAAGASGGVIETIAGAAPFQTPVNALQTGFGLVEGVAEDSTGNLYVASCDLGVVLKIDSNSNTTVYAGQPLPVGPALSSGDGGPATKARLPCPTGLAFDSANNLYVTDWVASTVRKISAATGTIQTIAGTPGESGHGGDGGPATSALLEYPTAVTLDGAGHLYIADLEYIREVNLASGTIRTIAGVGSQPAQCWLTASSTCPATQVQLYGASESLVLQKDGSMQRPVFCLSARRKPLVVRLAASSPSIPPAAQCGRALCRHVEYLPRDWFAVGPWGHCGGFQGRRFHLGSKPNVRYRSQLADQRFRRVCG